MPISFSIVNIGYQIDILDHKEFLKGKLKIENSECRDFPIDQDAEEVEKKLIEVVRNPERFIWQPIEELVKFKDVLFCFKNGDIGKGYKSSHGLFFHDKSHVLGNPIFFMELPEPPSK
jgi:hypothetical protein